MQIYLDKITTRQIRLSAMDAIEEGDLDTLREDLYNSFGDMDIEELDLRVDSGDFLELLQDVIDEWSGEDVDELLELLETELSDVEVELRYVASNPDADGEDGEDEDEDEDEVENEGHERLDEDYVSDDPML